MNDRIITNFRTSDLALVAFLRYSGLTVTEVVKESDRRAIFVFEQVKKDLIDEFNADQACVEPKLFSAIMRQQHRAARRVINE